MYKKILVAYNGTPESRSALDEANHYGKLAVLPGEAACTVDGIDNP